MERQIIAVVEENYRLNNLKMEMDLIIKNQNQRLSESEYLGFRMRIDELERLTEDLEN